MSVNLFGKVKFEANLQDRKRKKSQRFPVTDVKKHHLSFLWMSFFFYGWSKVYSISHKVLADALIAAQRHTGPFYAGLGYW